MCIAQSTRSSSLFHFREIYLFIDKFFATYKTTFHPQNANSFRLSFNINLIFSALMFYVCVSVCCACFLYGKDCNLCKFSECEDKTAVAALAAAPEAQPQFVWYFIGTFHGMWCSNIFNVSGSTSLLLVYFKPAVVGTCSSCPHSIVGICFIHSSSATMVYNHKLTFYAFTNSKHSCTLAATGLCVCMQWHGWGSVIVVIRKIP